MALAGLLAYLAAPTLGQGSGDALERGFQNPPPSARPRVVIRGWIVTATALLPALITGPIFLGAVLVGAWLFVRWVGGDLGVSEGPAKIPPL